MRGHAAHDNQSYVAKELLEEWRKKDPLENFERKLLENDFATAAELETVRNRVEALLDEDLAWTESQGTFKGEDAATGVYA
jgi:pyruvate dehydrogenase E1 component alpha subunit